MHGVFYTLYSGSGQNVEVIKVASEACRNTYMEKQIKEKAVRGMLQDGKGLMEGLEASGVFTKTALSRFRLGAETGDLKKQRPTTGRVLRNSDHLQNEFGH